MPKQDVVDEAAGWLAKVICAVDVSTVLPALHGWLREDASHRAAYRAARRAWRLATPFARAGLPGAGLAETEAFLQALEAETAALCQSCSPRERHHLM